MTTIDELTIKLGKNFTIVLDTQRRVVSYDDRRSYSWGLIGRVPNTFVTLTFGPLCDLIKPEPVSELLKTKPTLDEQLIARLRGHVEQADLAFQKYWDLKYSVYPQLRGIPHEEIDKAFQYFVERAKAGL